LHGGEVSVTEFRDFVHFTVPLREFTKSSRQLTADL